MPRSHQQEREHVHEHCISMALKDIFLALSSPLLIWNWSDPCGSCAPPVRRGTSCCWQQFYRGWRSLRCSQPRCWSRSCCNYWAQEMIGKPCASSRTLDSLSRATRTAIHFQVCFEYGAQEFACELVKLCRRLARMVLYMLQILLGAGSAGTPSPVPGQRNIFAQFNCSFCIYLAHRVSTRAQSCHVRCRPTS